ncbi:MAG: DUF4876 domain-containing protein [Candidatus Krumholzibacteriota bacterium]|nr:DUF4876 domain-containing protein [Candidatus Krumholzibacteriota bacterium]
MRRLAAISLFAALALSWGCAKKMPNEPDGTGSIFATVADVSGFFEGSVPGEPFPLDGVEVRIQGRTHDFSGAVNTGNGSTASFDRLPAGRYSLFARKEVLDGDARKIFTGSADILVDGGGTVDANVTTDIVGTSDLLINEIFYAGSDASSFFFYDQYVEIHNSSGDTLYLDGMFLTRQTQTVYPDQNDIDHVRALYVFQFPGTPATGRQYPIAPGEYVVVAADAVDHSAWIPSSIDLSVADWEFFNPLANDYDNPDVPNIISINPYSRSDYLINLAHGSVVLATGEEYFFEEMDEETIRVGIPIGTVVDGVEYASSTDKTKQLTTRVDAGFAGIGNTRYSGQSAERREPGLDTNDSTFDFELSARPTIGYSHAE